MLYLVLIQYASILLREEVVRDCLCVRILFCCVYSAANAHFSGFAWFLRNGGVCAG